jgi:hypothetical protein
MKCTAHTTAGNPCRNYAIKGGNVCKNHGGSAPQVKRKARERLLEAVDPAAAELARIALNGKSEQVRLNAIKELFARAGFGEPDRLTVITEDVLDAEIKRLEAELAE